MEYQIIFIYCLADTITQALGKQQQPQTKMTDSEIITFVMISALFYQCNYKLTRLVSQYSKLFPTLLSQSRIDRRIHQIPRSTWMTMLTICRGSLKENREFIIDSFPVAFCQNYKRFRCKLFPSKKFHGFTSSKKQYFFGIKVHMVVTSKGIPIEFILTPAAASDISGLRSLNLDLPQGSSLFADKAYTDYDLEDFLRNELGIQLISQRKANAKRQHSHSDQFKLSITRNRIETAFSSIGALMPRWIRARTEEGFCLKVVFFILAYSVKTTFL